MEHSVYLGSEVNSSNDIKNEIQKRILAANKSFHGLRAGFTNEICL